MKKCIPNRELDELGEGLVMTYIRKTGMKVLPKCVDIEGLANSLGLKVIYSNFPYRKRYSHLEKSTL